MAAQNIEIMEFAKTKAISLQNLNAFANGQTVTAGHAEICSMFGHGVWTIDGETSNTCPRCGHVEAVEVDETAVETEMELVVIEALAQFESIIPAGSGTTLWKDTYVHIKSLDGWQKLEYYGIYLAAQAFGRKWLATTN